MRMFKIDDLKSFAKKTFGFFVYCVPGFIIGYLFSASEPIAFAQLSATASIAAFAALIAYRQYDTARKKYFFDLYEKRNQAVQSLMHHWKKIVTNQESKETLHREWFFVRVQFNALFDVDITRPVDALHHIWRYGTIAGMEGDESEQKEALFEQIFMNLNRYIVFSEPFDPGKPIIGYSEALASVRRHKEAGSPIVEWPAKSD
ncbi:hypothetical protein SAMN06297251_10626 [Fulvimarina manganoxydans]|uniref:Uncharacterized protein n=1 Tax=Fulvimarina manganoxydans TaxID=937218 RepID=A0A1W2BBF7_9HYPH|nr:hypothetical protein [Fulvimarina manganoxydans]SMC70246.1 hypothetical protein SAMN06297251_10626 [Fulvimarina manganoxydans]